MGTNDDNPRIVRHAAVEPTGTWAPTDVEAVEAITQHLGKFIGEPSNVFHEVVSEGVHIDVHVIGPTPERDYYTLVTSGMSDLPMNAPEGAEGLRYAELVLALPRDWAPGPLESANLEDESLYWPIRLLGDLARLPHMHNTWLSFGHTVPNGDPPQPYAPNTELCCALLIPAVSFGPEFFTLPIRPDKTVFFFAVVPLYEAEVRLKLKKGADALMEALVKRPVPELIDPVRAEVVRKKRFLFF